MRHLSSLTVTLLLFLLVACGQTATPGTADQESSPPAERTPATAEALPETLLVYTREGGIAGFCDTLTIGVEEATWKSCRGNQSVTVPLDDQTRVQLADFVRRYSPLNQSGEDNPGGPDSLRQELDFRGIGTEELSEDALNELNGIVAGILEAASTQ